MKTRNPLATDQEVRGSNPLGRAILKQALISFMGRWPLPGPRRNREKGSKKGADFWLGARYRGQRPSDGAHRVCLELKQKLAGLRAGPHRCAGSVRIAANGPVRIERSAPNADTVALRFDLSCEVGRDRPIPAVRCTSRRRSTLYPKTETCTTQTWAR